MGRVDGRREGGVSVARSLSRRRKLDGPGRGTGVGVGRPVAGADSRAGAAIVSESDILLLKCKGDGRRGRVGRSLCWSLARLWVRLGSKAKFWANRSDQLLSRQDAPTSALVSSLYTRHDAQTARPPDSVPHYQRRVGQSSVLLCPRRRQGKGPGRQPPLPPLPDQGQRPPERTLVLQEGPRLHLVRSFFCLPFLEVDCLRRSLCFRTGTARSARQRSSGMSSVASERSTSSRPLSSLSRSPTSGTHTTRTRTRCSDRRLECSSCRTLRPSRPTCSRGRSRRSREAESSCFSSGR